MLVDPYDVASIVDGHAAGPDRPRPRGDLRRRGPERAREFSWARSVEKTRRRLRTGRTTIVRVALVHDWLTGMRGGEKVLEVLCELYPDADIFTLFHQPRIGLAADRAASDPDVLAAAAAVRRRGTTGGICRCFRRRSSASTCAATTS